MKHCESKHNSIRVFILWLLCLVCAYTFQVRAQESCYEQYLREHNMTILTAEDADDSYEEQKKAALAKQMYDDSYLLMLDTIAQRAVIAKADGTYIADVHMALVDSTWYMWLSVDPLADMYPNVTPYIYCNGNPVMLVDPDGRDWYQNEENQYYYWFEGNQEHEGYSYIGAKGTLLGEYENLIDRSLRLMDSQCDGPGYGLYSGVFSIEFASDNKTAFGSGPGGNSFMSEFKNNSGPDISICGDNHIYTKQMKRDPHVAAFQNKVNQSENGSYLGGKRNWNVLDVLLTEAYAEYVDPLFIGDAAQFIGTYSYSGRNINGTIYNVIADSKSVYSLFYHLPQIKSGNRTIRTNNYGNTYQFYIWASK